MGFGAFTPDSQQVVTHGYKDHVRLVNAQDGTLVEPRNCGPSSIYSYTYNWTWAPGSATIARIALTH